MFLINGLLPFSPLRNGGWSFNVAITASRDDHKNFTTPEIIEKLLHMILTKVREIANSVGLNLARITVHENDLLEIDAAHVHC